MAEKTLRICEKGHRYFKSSDCPTCPKCEALNKLNNEFLALHGIGRSSLPKFYAALETVGLTFQPEERTSG
jgi:hypothetical protein